MPSFRCELVRALTRHLSNINECLLYIDQIDLFSCIIVDTGGNLQTLWTVLCQAIGNNHLWGIERATTYVLARDWDWGTGFFRGLLRWCNLDSNWIMMQLCASALSQV